MTGHRSDDDIAFFAADLGPTRKLACSVASASPPASEGPMTPGRYLIQIHNLSGNMRQIVWLTMGKFDKAAPLVALAVPPAFPLNLAAIAAIEVHVRKDVNDQLAAIAGAGTADLYFTLVSRDV